MLNLFLIVSFGVFVLSAPFSFVSPFMNSEEFFYKVTVVIIAILIIIIMNRGNGDGGLEA